jgi:hypothetical protein
MTPNLKETRMRDIRSVLATGCATFLLVATCAGAASARTGTLTITADNDYLLWVNGQFIGSMIKDGPWEWDIGDVRQLTLQDGVNTFAVRCNNYPSGGAVGLIAFLRTPEGDSLVTNTQWKVASTAPANWFDPGFDDSSWGQAVELGDYTAGPWSGFGDMSEFRGTGARWIWKDGFPDTCYARARLSLASLAGVPADAPRGGAAAILWAAPNVTRSQTTVRFRLAQPGPVRLQVLDTAGRVRRTLLDREETAGEHLVRWDGGDADGRAVASGVYFIAMESSRTRATARVVLIR